ncbi:MAG TPA: phosphoribosylformylglycinamidine synthase, partial [Chromatiales bacterium]|nr:phosphoribosylformylglycinamidine synthase [Chromatiales bacterium]
EGYAGEAMAMGERSPVAVLDAPASGRLAVSEAVTNLLCADVGKLSDVRLSANWMAASGVNGQDEALFDTVDAVADLCRELGIAIPVGKDSLSMQTRWQQDGAEHVVTAPVSLVVSAFAPVLDIRRTLTAQLRTGAPSVLYLIDLADGRNRLGASCLAQAFNIVGGEPADLDSPAQLHALFDACRQLREAGLILALHDRSDGGLFVSLCEMAFAGRQGLDIHVPDRDPVPPLFAEEPGVVIQVRAQDADQVEAVLSRYGLSGMKVADVIEADRIRIHAGGELVYDQSRTQLHREWSSLTRCMHAARDNPVCADEAYQVATDPQDPGLNVQLGFDLAENPAAAYVSSGVRPAVAILREQGVNSHVEMAAAFHRAGFQPVDVHMTDLLEGRRGLDEFKGLVACGGFSYGDVLGAGGGWAKSILFHPRARDLFGEFFERADSFTLGVCNGCQMLARLAEIIPGAEHWPQFVANRSGQFEARLSLVEVQDSASVLLEGMAGSRLLIATSHGEGRAQYENDSDARYVLERNQLSLRYVDNFGRPTQHYPENPNGSPDALAGLCSEDGRVTIMMPHPERVFRSVQHSWCPEDWGEDGPWMRMFRNARAWVA